MCARACSPPPPFLSSPRLRCAQVSSASFQLLQGVAEPRVIDPLVRALDRRVLMNKQGGEGSEGAPLSWPAAVLKWALMALVRAARGIFVSGLAIRGMQATGLQKISS